MNKKDLSELYDLIYKCADLLFKKYDPCKIKNGKCVLSKLSGKPNCCCDFIYEGLSERHGKEIIKCNYLSKSGCTVKSLPCKLWFCFSDIAKRPKMFDIKLRLLKQIYENSIYINHINFKEYRTSKREFFENYKYID